MTELAINIERRLQAHEKDANRTLELVIERRVEIARILPHLPHTLEDYFKLVDVWVYNFWPGLRFTASEAVTDETASLAFGTIIKCAAALMRAGYEVKPQPKIEAADHKEALNVEIEGRRDGKPFYIEFSQLPESDRCKLVKEEVFVPARTEVKLTVVCEGEPVQLGSRERDAVPPAIAPDEIVPTVLR